MAANFEGKRVALVRPCRLQLHWVAQIIIQAMNELCPRKDIDGQAHFE